MRFQSTCRGPCSGRYRVPVPIRSLPYSTIPSDTTHQTPSKTTQTPDSIHARIPTFANAKPSASATPLSPYALDYSTVRDHPQIVTLQKQLSHVRANLHSAQANFERRAGQHLTTLGLKINEVTGYEEVERLKTVVIEREESLRLLRDHARNAKTAYDTAITTRSSSQRDVNSLLERKHSWNDADVSAFTTLVRSDHNSTAAVASTSLFLKEAELSVDKAFTDLTRAILERYHEEQVWSDKIRNVSTWANLVGLAINLVVFIGAIAIVEPWKRRRLVERLEERIAGMMLEVDGGVGSLATRLDGIEGLLKQGQPGGAVAPVDVPVPDDPHLIDTSKPRPYTTPLPLVLSPRLNAYIAPSPERDIALIGLTGALSGISLLGIFRWLLRGS